MRFRRKLVHPAHATVAEAIQFLASVCDGATRRDSIGFGADHVAIGHRLATRDSTEWTPYETAQGRQLVIIYQRQLGGAGFAVDSILAGRRKRRCSPRMVSSLIAGWATDPFGFNAWRYWNGARWTHHLAAEIPLESYEFVRTV